VYADELVQLQDQVPPFSTMQAREILMRELDLPNAGPALSGPTGVFRTLSEDPLAAASIGVVFKATLADGREVAVKVQRPNAFSVIALDLFLVRVGVAARSVWKREPVDLRLVDEWGRGFLNECDYLAEADNTMNFIAAMEARGLDAVTSPAVVRELSTSCVLVTEWVDGTRSVLRRTHAHTLSTKHLALSTKHHFCV
jgi:aarF domain-containing kinase